MKIQTSSFSQRGHAAHRRQLDDNSRRKKLTSKERKFLNKVIHDRSMDHRPDFEEQLEELMSKWLPDHASDADVTREDGVIDRREFERAIAEDQVLKEKLQLLSGLLMESCRMVHEKDQILQATDQILQALIIPGAIMVVFVLWTNIHIIVTFVAIIVFLIGVIIIALAFSRWYSV